MLKKAFFSSSKTTFNSLTTSELEDKYKFKNVLLRKYVSDAYDYRLLTDLYEKRDASKPYFMFNVTMQNHSPYNLMLPESSQKVHLKGLKGTYPQTEQYLDIIRESDKAFKSLVNEGDTVVVESPSFIGGLNSIKSYNANIKTVPVFEDGLDTQALEEIAKSEKIKIVYTIPTFQNPSGITMSLEKRKKMLELAEKYDFFILEDNPYGELRYNGEEIATMKSLDTEGRVIYAGSFSKILSAGMRIGWCIAREDIMEKIIICKQVSDVHTPVLTQMAAYEFCTQYSLDEHIAKSRALYKARCTAMLSALDRYFPKDCSFTRPDGGIFLWCTLPERIDTKALLPKAVEKKVAFVPGATCESDDKSSANMMRLNYSLPSEEKIEQGIKILSEVISEQ